MRQIELAEESDLYLSKDELNDQQALALYRDPRFELEWPNPGNNFQYRLRSKGWVGHIPVDGTVVVVRPKVPIASIFRMLELAYKLKSFNILEGETAVESLEEIYERIASILAKRVNDRFRHGLYRSYLERNNDLEYLRGRIDIRANIRNAIITAPRLHCRYEELTADLEENALLLLAIYLASRVGLKRDDVKRQVRQAYRNLIGTVSLEPKIARDCIGRFYHRLNDDYRPMHMLCRFLIEQTGPGTNVGNYDFLPFSLDMPKLFEEFVGEWLNENLPEALRVDTQYHVQLNANEDLSFRIDLVLRNRRSGQAVAVIDVKYKLADKPSESDIQQVVAYAVELGVSRAHLVYPFRLSHSVQAKIGNITISTVGIDLNRPFAESWKLLEHTLAPYELCRPK
jgi:5-methylcytosine-specific restriction enzyme subunit McrC